MDPPNLRKCDSCSTCIYFVRLATWGEGECRNYPQYGWSLNPDDVCDSFKEAPTESDH